MLKLNVNEDKQLTFNVEIGGVQSDQLMSHLRIVIDGIEYGFPAEIGRETITVNLPALKTVTSRKLKEGQQVDVKLDIIADGNYLTPWTDTFQLSNPLVVEAKIVDKDFKGNPSFKTKLIKEGESGDAKQKVIVEKKTIDDMEDVLTKRIVNKLMEKLENINQAEKMEDDADQKTNRAEELEDEAEKEEEEAAQESKITPISRRQLLSLKEEDVYEYMKRAGTKNGQIQKIIYDQAESKAASSKPVDVLREVIKILKRKE